ncbi:MAG: DUF881 domain-containing protein [Anaerolineales bacterium]|nr:DUF881 domain-containing protein [Anaerolineales bacterium]
MKSRSAQLSLTILCFFLGLLMVAQLRAQRMTDSSLLPASSADQLVIISSLVENNARLRGEMEALEEQLSEYQQATRRTVLEALVEELNKIRIINGLVEVSGFGVEVSLDGPIGVLDVQDLINELRNDGAEALTINGERLTLYSVIASAEDGVMTINGTQLSRPYILQAIGDPETMETALLRSGGLIATLAYNYEGLIVGVIKQERMVLPVYKGDIEFVYASPIE